MPNMYLPPSLPPSPFPFSTSSVLHVRTSNTLLVACAFYTYNKAMNGTNLKKILRDQHSVFKHCNKKGIVHTFRRCPQPKKVQ